MRRFSTKGFTMIELLIVIAIIGVLATIGLGAAFGQSRKAAKDAKMKSHLAALQIALENYYSDSKSYPNLTSIADVAGDLYPDFFNEQTKNAIQEDLGAASIYAPVYQCTITKPNPLPPPAPPILCKAYEMSITLQVDNDVFIVESN
jgi:prepilin-type N-terminal cleavage/methylation domain-containing protein